MRVAVLGAGAWGTAVACHAARRHDVLLWGRDPELVGAIESDRVNARYLPDQPLGDRLRASADIDEARAFVGADGLVVLATSMAGLRPVASALAAGPGVGAPVLWLCKGLERDTERLAHAVVAEALPGREAGALSGPSFAQEVAAGLPVALVAASAHEAVRARAVAAFHHDACRIYTTDDVVGVELAGALKNVIAIAAGACDGLALGMNARAALITRGLAEMTRLGLALGARPATFVGLTGVGDLMLTCTGDLSRNRRVGLALARGTSLEEALGALGHVAEGVPTTAAVRRLARQHGVDMPIVDAVHSVLFDRVPVREAVGALLARGPRSE